MDAEQLEQVSDCLQRLLDDTGANYSALLDEGGQIVAVQGDVTREDTPALGKLIAGTFAAGQDAVRLLKEKDFRVLFQQGIKENIFTELIAERWMLLVMFDKRTHIGLVKVMAQRTVDELQAILGEDRGSGGNGSPASGSPASGGPPTGLSGVAVLHPPQKFDNQ